MNFFEQQRLCKQNSRLLVVLFFISAAIVAVLSSSLIYFFLNFQMDTKLKDNFESYNPWLIEDYKSFFYSFLNYPSFWYTATAIVLGLASISIFKSHSLGRRGAYIARSLGGDLASSFKDDFLARRYINIVEEMSLASGVPVPAIFIQNSETSINAFAAGHDLNNAAICVTRGALLKLNRDELQAVVGHEFSHILNGDMNLNIKLIGYIFGLSFISESGFQLIRGTWRNSKYKRKKLDNVDQFALLGLGLLILGALGMFFASLIKSLLSRQREYLADAAAVQFTRNPDAVASVLKKLWLHGSQIEAPKASEASHMFFAEALTHSFHFSTHPPLIKRIQAIDSNYSFEKFKLEKKEIARSLERTENSNSQYTEPASTPQTEESKNEDLQDFMPASAAFFMNAKKLGNIDKKSTDKIHSRLENVPSSLNDLVHDVSGAFTFLISSCAPATLSDGIINKLLTPLELQSLYLPSLKLQTQIDNLSREQWFSLVKISVATLKSSEAHQLKQIQKALLAVAKLDKIISRKEMIVLLYVTTLLNRLLENMAKKRHGYIKSTSYLFSYLSRMSSQEPEVGLSKVSNKHFVGQLFYEKILDFERLSHSLIELSASPLSLKQKIIDSGLMLIQHDGKISNDEYIFFRLLAECLDIPLPQV